MLDPYSRADDIHNHVKKVDDLNTQKGTLIATLPHHILKTNLTHLTKKGNITMLDPVYHHIRDSDNSHTHERLTTLVNKLSLNDVYKEGKINISNKFEEIKDLINQNELIKKMRCSHQLLDLIKCSLNGEHSCGWLKVNVSNIYKPKNNSELIITIYTCEGSVVFNDLFKEMDFHLNVGEPQYNLPDLVLTVHQNNPAETLTFSLRKRLNDE